VWSISTKSFTFGCLDSSKISNFFGEARIVINYTIKLHIVCCLIFFSCECPDDTVNVLNYFTNTKASILSNLYTNIRKDSFSSHAMLPTSSNVMDYPQYELLSFPILEPLWREFPISKEKTPNEMPLFWLS